MSRRLLRVDLLRLAVTASFLLLATLAWAGPYNILHVFLNTPHPSSGLVIDSFGNAYGTTFNGGGHNSAGTVYKLSSVAGYQTIYSFSGPDGSNPYGSLTIDSAGNLYGTTTHGGLVSDQCPTGCGTVYRLTPPNNDGAWAETTLYSFTGESDGALIRSGVIFDSNGNLYGAARQGGPAQCGTVFELTPSQNDQWIEQTLFAFGSAGCDPGDGLVFDTDGNLYGTTIVGGASNGGTAFQLSPLPDGTWAYSTIYEFNSYLGDGSEPSSGLSIDQAGNLYGVTSGGGSSNFGTAFELSPSGGNWAESILYNFLGGDDGANPQDKLVFDGKGDIYGVTFKGGGSHNYGTIFRLAPVGNGSWTESSFSMGSGSRGQGPIGPVLLDAKGHLYGTAWDGGRDKKGIIGHGVVYRLNIGE